MESHQSSEILPGHYLLWSARAEAFSCYTDTLLAILNQHTPAREQAITTKNDMPWYNVYILNQHTPAREQAITMKNDMPWYNIYILNQHTPAREHAITVKSDMPWYNVDIKVTKAKRKRLEHQYRKTWLSVHREMFLNQRNKVNNMCSEAKNHYKEKLSDVRNQAEFYNIANKLLHHGNTTTLPTYEWEHNNTTNLRMGTQQHYQPTSGNTTTLPTYEWEHNNTTNLRVGTQHYQPTSGNTTTLPTYEWEHNNTTYLRVGTQHYQPTSENTTTLPTYEWEHNITNLRVGTQQHYQPTSALNCSPMISYTTLMIKSRLFAPSYKRHIPILRLPNL